jgi:hypothetical protein
LLLLLAGCDGEEGTNERRAIRTEDQPVVLRVVRQDLQRGVVGVRSASELMAGGFLVEDAAQQERQMRQLLRSFRQPASRRAIAELMVTPVSFVAAVGMDGKVIARDAEPDRMRGFDIARVAPVVRRALREGRSGYELGELPSTLETDPPSVTVLFAAPARHDGRVVGAIVAGLPLWRLGQQLTNQLQLENASDLRRGALVWALVYRGDALHEHAGFPPDLKTLAPDRAARRSHLASKPHGYTSQVQQYGRWYGYGVLPLPSIGEDVGVILFRSDPTS